MVAVTVVQPTPPPSFSPSALMSPAAAAYASKACTISPSSPPSSSTNKTSRIFRRVSRNISSPFSATNNTAASTSSPFSPSYSLVSTPVEQEKEILAPRVASSREEDKENKAVRRLSRKPVPSSLELDALEAEPTAERQPRTKRARASSPTDVVDGLWTSTCDARDDDLDLPFSASPSASPILSSRRWSIASSSSGSTTSTASGFTSPVAPAVADLAILLSTSARRASIPSPAALAGNAALSPRLARIAAFTNTVTHPSRTGDHVGQVEKAAADYAAKLHNSLVLPEIELPWLPTLFSDATSATLPPSAAAFPSPPARMSLPPSPATSTSGCGTGAAMFHPLSLHRSHSSSADSDHSSPDSSTSGLSAFSHSDSSSSTSSLGSPPASLSPKTSSSHSPPRAPAPSTRKSLFRITTASGAQLILDLPLPLSLPLSAPASPSLSSSSGSGSSSFRQPSLGNDSEWGESDEVGGEKGVGTGVGVGVGVGVEGGVSTSWVERDEEDEEGEVLVIALAAPRVG
ncbi:hypothetical protein JCM11251_005913 [Rhodosporidiobolus azoricus]